MAHGQNDESVAVPEDGTRSFIAEVRGEEYISYSSLQQAASDPDAAIVLSGDHGGTVFLTAPVRLVGCDVGALRTLVSDLDAVTWMSGDRTSATVAIERHPVGTGVMGGQGGGLVIKGVWIHPYGIPEEVHCQAREVVTGVRARIDVGFLRQVRERELTRKKERYEALATQHELDEDFDIPPPVVPFG